MRFVSGTDSFGKDIEGGCHVHLILASFFLHILAFILPKDMKKMRTIDKPMGFRLSKKKKEEHLVAFTVGWQIWDIGDFICK